jgi:hypothetical protein
MDVVRPNVPTELATSRVFLRSTPLAWEYGGHTIDVVSLDVTEYEGRLLEQGIGATPIDRTPGVLRAGGS